jgi:hypothetical protein
MARQKTMTEKDKQIGVAYQHAKSRAREQNLPFNITAEYLRKMAPDFCPIFNTKFEWGASGLGPGKFKPNGPQLDRIIPELGYVIGNVAFISHRANRIKDNGTMEEHYAIADWIWEHHHAKQNTTTSLSDPYNTESDEDSELRAILAAGIGKDKYDLDDYLRAVYRQDFNYSAKTSGGDSVGSGDFEVEPSEASAYIEGIRYSSAKIIRHLNRIGYLHRKFRERCLADGAVPELPELSDRREQSVQGSINKTLQSSQKALKKLQTTYHTDWHTDSPGGCGPLGTSGDLGPGAATGNQSNEV